jgi:hypothetical protein
VDVAVGVEGEHHVDLTDPKLAPSGDDTPQPTPTPLDEDRATRPGAPRHFER